MKILKYLFTIFIAIIIIGITILLHQSSPALFNLAYLIGLVILLFKAIADVTKSRFHFSVIFLVGLSLFITQFDTFQNTLTPIVISQNIEIPYDLKSPDFIKNKKITILASSGDKIILEKESGNINYKLHFPNPIVDVETFYTSYDNNGQHNGRWTWTKNVDYTFSNNYIRSSHQLNDTVNNGKGRHIVVYKYRSPIFTQIFSQAQLLWGNLSENLKTFSKHYAPFVLSFIALAIMFFYFPRIWELFKTYIDRIVLSIIFAIALKLRMQALAIISGLLFILGIRMLTALILSFINNVEEINFWGVRFKRYVKAMTPGKLKISEISSGVSAPEFGKYYQQGDMALKQNNIPLAKTMFEKAKELDPSNVQANISLGLIYNMLGENKKSIMFSKKALELSPSNFVAQFNLAVATNHLLGSEKSLPEYLEAEKIAKDQGHLEDSTIGKLNLFLGHDYREIGDLEESRRRYKEAIRIFKLYDTPEAKFWLKDTLKNMKRLDELE